MSGSAPTRRNPIYTYGAAKAPLQAGFLYAPVSCDGHFGSSAAFDVGRGFGGTTSRTASNSLSFSIVSINKRQSLATVVPRVSAASSMRAHVAGGIESLDAVSVPGPPQTYAKLASFHSDRLRRAIECAGYTLATMPDSPP